MNMNSKPKITSVRTSSASADGDRAPSHARRLGARIRLSRLRLIVLFFLFNVAVWAFVAWLLMH
jgi:hypothetical protein